MPKALATFPRPIGDNGRGLHGCALPGWNGGKEGYAYWLQLLDQLRVKWFKVVDADGDSLPLCERLLAAGIFPVVRLLRRDPPPNDAPEPNPGHLGPHEEETIRRLVAAGVRYFETNNEPDQAREWKNRAMPSNSVECAKLVALNWLFDARIILELGGLPGLPAISAGGNLDLIGALATLGRQEILLEGTWIAIHNFSMNRPLNFPDDAVNRTGQLLTPEQYYLDAYTEWGWWHNNLGRAQTIDEINAIRASGKNPAQTIAQDHACFREYEYHNQLAVKYLGRSIPILSTACGYIVGNRADPRFSRVTPEIQREGTVALFEQMQRQAPDYYFAALPYLLIQSPGEEANAWHSSFWQNAFSKGTDGQAGIPTVAAPNARVGAYLPVIDAVKAMPNLARRLPGMQPAPPLQAPMPASPARISSAPPRPFPGVMPPAEAPSPTKPETARAEPPATIRYTIQPGDTIYKIAREFGVAWQLIAQANDIKTPSLMHAGQMLVIPITRSPAESAETQFPNVPLPPAPSAPARPPESPPPLSSPSTNTLRREAPARADDSTARTRVPELSPRADEPRERAEVDWDPRLDAMNVRIDPAKVSPGQLFWRLIRAEYASPEESGGKHQIVYVIHDEADKPLANQRVWQGWTEDKSDAATDARGEASIPIWASYTPDRESGPYFAWVEGLPSDRVTGMGLPMKRQVSFLLTWKKSVA